MKRTVVLFALFMMTAMSSFAQTRGAIVFHRSGYRPFFTFQSKNYYREALGGYSSLVAAVEVEVPQDHQIQQLGLEYHRKRTIGVTLMMTGLLTTLGVAGYRVYQHTYPTVTPQLGLGTALLIDASAVVTELLAYFWAGPPKKLVGYYNQHYATTR